MKLLNRLLLTLLIAIALIHYSHGSKLSEDDPMTPYQVAGVVLGDEQATASPTKKATGSGVKITPSNNNHQLNGAPTLLMDGKDRKQYRDRSLGRRGNLLDKSIQVKQQPKKQLIEGYRMNSRGRGTSYVYGEVSKNKKGQVSGYLYDKRGKPTYVYGQENEVKTGGGRSANSSEDSGGIYLQDEQHNDYQMNRQND